MTNFLVTFVILSIINVVFSTARTIVTVKGDKLVASLVSGGYFAFYNIMLVYTVADFPMWQKCLITFIANVIGVFTVKFLEEKMRKDKMWKIEATFRNEHLEAVDKELSAHNISHSYIPNVGKHCIFNIYCETSGESILAKEIITNYKGKYFASETKLL